MDGVHVSAAGEVDDGGNVQISAQRALIFSDEISLVGLGAEQAVGVLVGVHRYGVQAQVVTGPEHTNGNLSPVGYQHLVEFVVFHVRRSILSVIKSFKLLTEQKGRPPPAHRAAPSGGESQFISNYIHYNVHRSCLQAFLGHIAKLGR
ncbi:hypothetical protein SDC9_87936 [bioreactor metagenome]|uniref:Uncharacterized protein n=1 Tax=bioreactor metagenome TaxID=1076179 RepID=A0A644ZK81_9ZZZZ